MRMMTMDDAISYYAVQLGRLHRAKNRMTFADCPAVEHKETNHMIHQEIVETTRIIQSLYGHIATNR